MSVSRRDFVAAALTATAGSALAPLATGAVAAAEEKGKHVYVVATITLKEGVRDDFIEIFRDNMRHIHIKEGCEYYQPAVDVESGISAQGAQRANVVVVVEKWSSLDNLRAHLAAPHMAEYREKVKDMVEGVDLQVLGAA